MTVVKVVEADGGIIAVWGGNAVIVDSLTQRLHHRVDIPDVLDGLSAREPSCTGLHPTGMPMTPTCVRSETVSFLCTLLRHRLAHKFNPPIFPTPSNSPSTRKRSMSEIL